MNDIVHRLLRERSLVPLSAPVLPCDYHNLVKRRLKPACRAAGVSVDTFHDLRHTFASHLAMLGVSVFHIKEVLGHADLETTMRYMHLAPGHPTGLTDILMSQTSLPAPKRTDTPATTIGMAVR